MKYIVQDKNSTYYNTINKIIQNRKNEIFAFFNSEEKESNSITNQKLIIDNYLKEHKEYKLVDYYIDDGYSGTNFNRPEFQRMLEDIKYKKIDVIIIKDLSRLGRNYIEIGNYI